MEWNNSVHTRGKNTFPQHQECSAPLLLLLLFRSVMIKMRFNFRCYFDKDFKTSSPISILFSMCVYVCVHVCAYKFV